MRLRPPSPPLRGCPGRVARGRPTCPTTRTPRDDRHDDLGAYPDPLFCARGTLRRPLHGACPRRELANPADAQPTPSRVPLAASGNEQSKVVLASSCGYWGLMLRGPGHFTWRRLPRPSLSLRHTQARERLGGFRRIALAISVATAKRGSKAVARTKWNTATCSGRW